MFVGLHEKGCRPEKEECVGIFRVNKGQIANSDSKIEEYRFNAISSRRLDR